MRRIVFQIKNLIYQIRNRKQQMKKFSKIQVKLKAMPFPFTVQGPRHMGYFNA